MTVSRSRALLVYLPILLLTSCTASRQAVVIHPPPTEVLGSEEGEAELRRAWEIWDELRHRTPPGVSWRAVEAENRRRNLALRAALVETGPAAAAALHWRERGSFDQTSPAGEACVADDRTLCLHDGRFEVRMDWRDFQDGRGQGHVAPPRSGDSGVFWFFAPTNWEALIKVLDGCSLNGHYWVFGAASTTVEYTLQVTDTVTGQHREYFNPLGRISPTIADTNALPCN